MEKQEKSWIDEEREREQRNYVKLNGETYYPEDNLEGRTRVIGEEDAGYEPNRLKKFTLIALASLVIAAPLTFYAFKAVDKDTNKPEQQQEQVYKSRDENVIGAVRVGDVTLEIATPVMRIDENGIGYGAPNGFTYDGYNCYRLSCEGEAPAGYVKGEDNTLYPVDSEIKYQAPEKYILVGDKAVEVIDATEEQIDGKTVYSLPEGYLLVGKLGFKMIKAIPLEDEYGNRININETTKPIITTTYSVPSGYTLSGTKGTKTVIVSPTETTVDGKTVYTVPQGYTLEYVDGKPRGVKTVTVDATANRSYKAPEGYILINGTCYKLEAPTEEKTKGR